MPLTDRNHNKTMIYLKIFLIAVIVQLIHEAGFFDHIEKLLKKRNPLYRLPKLLSCSLCQTFWLSILYILYKGSFDLEHVAGALVGAHSTELVSEAFYVAKGLVRKSLEWIAEKAKL